VAASSRRDRDGELEIDDPGGIVSESAGGGYVLARVRIERSRSLARVSPFCRSTDTPARRAAP
jgi:hypothetical protein